MLHESERKSFYVRCFYAKVLCPRMEVVHIKDTYHEESSIFDVEKCVIAFGYD